MMVMFIGLFLLHLLIAPLLVRAVNHLTDWYPRSIGLENGEYRLITNSFTLFSTREGERFPAPLLLILVI
jgi:hypothetical protein